MSDNTARRQAAHFALRSHAWAKGDAMAEQDLAVIDLLSDLRHFCEGQGLSFPALYATALSHYEQERRPS